MTYDVAGNCFDVFLLVAVHWFGYSCALLIMCMFVVSKVCIGDMVDSVSQTKLSFISAAMFTTAAASAAGLPPFFGFWTKTAIFIKISCMCSFATATLCAILIFLGLIFYLYILRAVCSVRSKSAITSIKLNAAGCAAIFAIAVNCFGFLFFDDMLIVFSLLL